MNIKFFGLMVKEIGGISVSRMSNGAHYTFIFNVLERADASEAVKEKVSADITALRDALEAEGDKMGVMTKSALTRLIKENDTLRDESYIGYKSVVRGFLAHPEGSVLTAAEKLWTHIESRDIRTNIQLDKQTGLMKSFLDELEGKYPAEVATLGLTTLVATMKEANEKVFDLMMARDTESSTKTVGAVKIARAATDEAYRMLVKKVNAHALLEGDAAYASFIDEMNAQITHFKRDTLGETRSTPAAAEAAKGETQGA